MKHAAKPSQLKLTFFFAFITFVTFIFIEPFLQLTFFFKPLIRFIIFEQVFVFAITELPFIFKLEQQTGCGSIVLSARIPSGTFFGSKASPCEPAYRIQTDGRQRIIVDVRPQARLYLLSLRLDRHFYRNIL